MSFYIDLIVDIDVIDIKIGAYIGCVTNITYINITLVLNITLVEK